MLQKDEVKEMNEIMDNQQRLPELPREKVDRVIVAAMGGALLGGSLFAGTGAIIGVLFGAIVGAARNDEVRRMRENSHE